MPPTALLTSSLDQRPSWQDRFDLRCTSADQAVRCLMPGMRVYLGGNISVPRELVAALVRGAERFQPEPLEIAQILTFGSSDYVAPGLEKYLRVNTMFIGADIREAVNAGRTDYTPCLLSEVPKMLHNGRIPLDAVLLQVSPPDRHGYCSLGVEVGVTRTAIDHAPILIAEINDQMPRTLGDSFIHVSRLTHIVPVSYSLPEHPMGSASEVEHRIGSLCAELIEDGSTLQLGIGGIPDAVLGHLAGKKDLGIHTELFSDGVVDLVKRGVITGARKSLHPGKIIAGFLIGTRKLFEFVDENPLVEMRATEYTNDPFVIAQNDRMVAINSAIEVDLTGQVCSDSIGNRFYSGVGGQMDFIYGASRSKGGVPIIALPSTALVHGKPVSKITALLKPGAGVVTSRNHVHYVITEHGIADLYGKSIRQRVRALINIAAPEFREELERAARELRWV